MPVQWFSQNFQFQDVVSNLEQVLGVKINPVIASPKTWTPGDIDQSDRDRQCLILFQVNSLPEPECEDSDSEEEGDRDDLDAGPSDAVPGPIPGIKKEEEDDMKLIKEADSLKRYKFGLARWGQGKASTGAGWYPTAAVESICGLDEHGERETPLAQWDVSKQFGRCVIFFKKYRNLNSVAEENNDQIIRKYKYEICRADGGLIVVPALCVVDRRDPTQYRFSLISGRDPMFIPSEVKKEEAGSSASKRPQEGSPQLPGTRNPVFLTSEELKVWLDTSSGEFGDHHERMLLDTKILQDGTFQWRELEGSGSCSQRKVRRSQASSRANDRFVLIHRHLSGALS